MWATFKSLVARAIPFDNSTNGFIANETQGAIEELSFTVSTSASPGFSWGRVGNSSTGSVLANEAVPSNITGRFVYINAATVVEVFVGNQDITTFDLEFFYHDGDGINLTILGAVSIINSRGGRFSVSWPIPTNKQLGCRLSSGTAKNIVAGAALTGSYV